MVNTEEQSLKQNSFEISKSTTGRISWKVKIYEDELETLDDKTRNAIRKIKLIETELVEE